MINFSDQHCNLDNGETHKPTQVASQCEAVGATQERTPSHRPGSVNRRLPSPDFRKHLLPIKSHPSSPDIALWQTPASQRSLSLHSMYINQLSACIRRPEARSILSETL
jgi:hypothetical protein